MTIEIRDNKFYGSYEVVGSFRADNESTESKTVRINFLFNGDSIKDVMNKACSSAKISWVNGPGRKNFDSWENGQVVTVDFASPGKTSLTDEQQMQKLANGLKAKGMTPEQMIEYLTKLANN